MKLSTVLKTTAAVLISVPTTFLGQAVLYGFVVGLNEASQETYTATSGTKTQEYKAVEIPTEDFTVPQQEMARVNYFEIQGEPMIEGLVAMRNQYNATYRSSFQNHADPLTMDEYMDVAQRSCYLAMANEGSTNRDLELHWYSQPKPQAFSKIEKELIKQKQAAIVAASNAALDNMCPVVVLNHGY